MATAWRHMLVRPLVLVAAAYLAIGLLGHAVDALLTYHLVGALDVPLFDARAEALLSGDWTYETVDRRNDVPPLVNAFFVPAHLLGGGIVAFQVLFTLASLAGAASVALLVNAVHPGAGPRAAYLYALNPLTVTTALFMVQDEALVPPLVTLALLALVRGRTAASGALTSLGVLVKAWPIVGAPVLLLATRHPRRWLLAALLPAALILLPYALFAPEYLSYLVSFYFGGTAPGQAAPTGLSFWTFVQRQGVPLSETALTIAAVVAAFVVALRLGREAPLVAYPVSFLAFLLLFPKTHLGYYLIPLAALMPFIVIDRALFLGHLVIPLPLLVAHLGWRPSPLEHLPETVPLVAAALVQILMAAAVARVLMPPVPTLRPPTAPKTARNASPHRQT